MEKAEQPSENAPSKRSTRAETYRRYNHSDKGVARRNRWENTSAAAAHRKEWMRLYMREYRMAKRMGITVPELRAGLNGTEPQP